MGGRSRRHPRRAKRCATGWRTCCARRRRTDAILLRHAHRRRAPTRSMHWRNWPPPPLPAASARPRRWTRAPPSCAPPAAWGCAAAARSPSPTPSPSARSPAITTSTPIATAAAYLQAVRRQPDLRRRAPGAARPDRRPARAGRARTDSSSARRRRNARRHAGRSRRRLLPLRPRRHATRNPVHEAVPLMTIPHTARCASASAARSAPARPR